MEVKIENILRTFKTDLKFNQPLFEAIANSFQAHAKTIDITFYKNENLLGYDYVGSICVGDDGDGFTLDNVNSFCEYLSDFKLNLGCKGVGRFTWLKIFNKIEIESMTNDSIVKFVFNKDFDRRNIKIQNQLNKKRYTTIKFEEIVNKYKDVEIDLDKFKKQILEYFMLTFINFKNTNRKFAINLIYNEKSESITLEDIVDLQKKEFDIFSSFDQTNYKFTILYNFIDKISQNQNECFLCGNGRTVEKYDLKKIFSTLPDNKIIKVLIISNYFDDRVNDERTEFTFSKSENNPNISNPLPFTQISENIIEKLSEIVLNEFPNIEDSNKNIIAECIEEKPYLAKYIKDDPSLIKKKKEVLENAQKAFEKEKEDVRKNFIKMLEDKTSTSDGEEFVKQLNKMNELSNRELAQYFIYRQIIIDALKRLDDNNEKIEKFLHNLFFEMGETSDISDSLERKYKNCIWLLDDKYMSYEKIFSDSKISKIKEEIKSSSNNDNYDGKEPDLTIFYSNHDIVVVEFKAIGAKTDDKLSAIPELSRNIGIIASHFENINNIYGYVITKFDDEFKKLIKYQAGVKPLFSTGNDPIYFLPNDNIEDSNGNKVNTFIYFISTNTIYNDANERNKMFIDIINNK